MLIFNEMEPFLLLVSSAVNQLIKSKRFILGKEQDLKSNGKSGKAILLQARLTKARQ